MDRLTDKVRNFDGTASAKQSLVNKGMPSDYCSKILTKLAEYEDAEEQGLLLKLPVPIGGEVYCIANNFGVKEISKNVVLSYVTAPNSTGGVIARGYMGTLFGIVGKRVFATQEEAEQALAKMKKV